MYRVCFLFVFERHPLTCTVVVSSCFFSLVFCGLQAISVDESGPTDMVSSLCDDAFFVLQKSLK